MTTCHAHPAGCDTGLDCQRTDPHTRGHIWVAESSAPDAKRDADEEVDR